MKGSVVRPAVALLTLVLAAGMSQEARADVVRPMAPTHASPRLAMRMPVPADRLVWTARAESAARTPAEVGTLASAASLPPLARDVGVLHETDTGDRSPAVDTGMKPDGMTSSLAGLALIVFLIGRRTGTF